MGNSQSSRASAKKIKAPNVEHNLQSESARGRKSLPTSGVDHATPQGLTNVEVPLFSTSSTVTDDDEGDDESIDYESEEEETDEEIDAGLAERRLILQDAKMLKQCATFHLHPEESVKTTSPFAKGRNYFNRSSAPEQLTLEESHERGLILEDAKQLKMYANFHLHPENPVETTDVTVCGRNFFTRASADEYFTEEDVEERELILAECMALKMVAGYHLHPERPVESHGDGTSFGRNFFGRESAPEQLMFHEAHERAAILKDAAMLQQYAGYHLHPERPVESQGDATSFGRNFFGRASAPEQLMFHEAHERAAILADAAMLKQYADFHFHPEKPVKTTDATICGRNFFMRASADEYFTEEDAEERETILAECSALKTVAGYHFHPERPVESQGDATSFGRNYFTRASAPEQGTFEAAEERAQILEEAAMLKQYAGYHFHPERPVETTDATICGRNFFTRASANEYLTAEDVEERETILAECLALKTVAGYHLHPERPVKSQGDGTSFGRNFFGRASAPDQLMFHEAHERAAILKDAAMLKQYAGYHFHPERPVESQCDSTSFCRNFFGRASAPDQLMFYEAHERAAILTDAAMLKQYAGYHFHPERPVESTDSMACARNYFTRPSAHIDADLITSEGRANSVAEAMVDETDYGFELDEDLHDLHDFRASLTKLVDERIAATDYTHPINSSPIKTIARSDDGEEQEGNLSRSPSSIMLFGYEENAY